jgi:antitoxin VapB
VPQCDPSSEAHIRRDVDRLAVDPAPDTGLLELLAGWEPLSEVFPDVDEALLPLRDVVL